MFRLFVAVTFISCLFAAPAAGEQKVRKPLLAEMQNLFTLVRTLKQENQLLKEQLMDISPAFQQVKATGKTIVLEQEQYEIMLKEIDRLKAKNKENEALIKELAEGFGL